MTQIINQRINRQVVQLMEQHDYKTSMTVTNLHNDDWYKHDCYRHDWCIHTHDLCIHTHDWYTYLLWVIVTNLANKCSFKMFRVEIIKQNNVIYFIIVNYDTGAVKLHYIFTQTRSCLTTSYHILFKQNSNV